MKTSQLKVCPHCNSRDKENFQYLGRLTGKMGFACQRCGYDWAEKDE